jgi:hypothetical protein
MTKSKPIKPTIYKPIQFHRTDLESFATAFTPAMCFTTLRTVYEFGLLGEWNLYRLLSECCCDYPSYELFQQYLQHIVDDELLACVKQSRQDRYHKGKNILPGVPGQKAYHLTALGEDYLESRGMHLTFGMNPACYAEALACSDALLQLDSLFPSSVILRGPARLLAWETTNGDVVISPDGLLIQPASHDSPEYAYLLMLQKDDQPATIQSVIRRYEILLQPALGWSWANWGLSKIPTLLFLDRVGDTARYAEELDRWQALKGEYAILTQADLWQGNLNIHWLTG